MNTPQTPTTPSETRNRSRSRNARRTRRRNRNAGRDDAPRAGGDTGQRTGGRQQQAPTREQRDDAPAKGMVRGTFSAHPRGFGFLDLAEPIGGADSAFVPPPLAGNLVDGDTIDVRVRPDDRGATVSEIGRVVARRSYVCGQLRGNKLHLDAGLGQLSLDVPGNLRPKGQGVVVARIETSGKRSKVMEVVTGPVADTDPASARLIAVTRAATPAALDGALADAGVADQALRDLLVARDEQRVEVRRRAQGIVPGQGLSRRQVTDTTVTVDGASTRDLDDAVSARQGGDGSVQVQVHIADVAALVGAGSTLDERARTLATSTYLADHTAPMLPVDISEDALSLLPGQDRDTLSVSFTVQRDGRISDVEPFLSRIRSDARLTYQRVQQHIDGQRLDGEVGRTVAAMARAAELLGDERDGRDTMDGLFTSARLEIGIEGGKVVATPAGRDSQAMGIIERLMVAANESVATWLMERDVPAIYRTHGGVNPQRAERLEAALKAAGADAEQIAENGFSAAALSKVIARGGRHADAVSQGAADAMGRAGYGVEPELHFGLDSRPYTHFTSPIRRYADLLVHRQLRAALAGETPVHDSDQLAELAGWIELRSGMAARAEALQRTLLWGMWCRNEIEAGRHREVEATVRRVTPAGLVVRLDEYGIGAFLPAQQLPAKVLSRGRLAVANDELADRSGTFRVGATTPARLSKVDGTGRVEVARAS